MFKDKFILSIVIGTVVLLAGGVFLMSNSSSTPQLESSSAEVMTTETIHDWGEIDMNDGVVTKTFALTNEGEDTLELANVKTSCACTNATVTIDGKKSPEFGMHTTSSWIGEVAPGKKAEVEVVFDPAFHGPQGTGAITREVIIETNDRNTPEIKFTASANVKNDKK